MEEFNKKLYQGSRISKLFGSVSFFFIIAGIGVLFGGHWLLTISFLVISTIFGYISYKFACGNKNPELYKTSVSGDSSRIPSPTEFGRTLGEIFIEACTKTELERLRESLGFPEELVRFGPEVIVLQLFLENYSTQIVFDKNKEYLNKLLDEFHDVVYKSIVTQGKGYPEIAATPNLLKERYEQYYSIVHKGMDRFMNEAPEAFLVNVLERKADGEVNRDAILNGSYSENYGMGLITMKMWIGETLKELIDSKRNMCNKYGIPT